MFWNAAFNFPSVHWVALCDLTFNPSTVTNRLHYPQKI